MAFSLSPIATSLPSPSASAEPLAKENPIEEEATQLKQPISEEETLSEISPTNNSSVRLDEDMARVTEGEEKEKSQAHTESTSKTDTETADQRENVFFALPKAFVQLYSARRPPFGYNGLGEIVYLRTYSRLIRHTDRREQWYETVERVVNGTYTMQKKWILSSQLEWNEEKAMQSAQEMYDRMYTMKFLPPGRGLWAMGTPLTEEKGLYAALNNCAFVSTFVDPAKATTQEALVEPYCFLMDAAMLGIGVGFDTKGAGKCIIQQPTLPSRTYMIPDTREGWVESFKLLLMEYFYGTEHYEMDYSLIRPAGQPIKGFGGISSGFGCLKDLHQRARSTLDPLVGSPLSIRGIVDIMNHIGVCVVSGNVRRTAEIAFGDYDNSEYIDLKNYEKNPDRMTYGWTSNNTVFADLGMNYKNVVDRIIANGEPGFAWLENMQHYARMDHEHVCSCPSESMSLGDCKCKSARKDARALGGNPCLEQTLESYEICCLVETFPFNHSSLEDYLRTLKFAYLYAKTVTLGKTHWPKTNQVMLRNRRIGCSISGIAQFLCRYGVDTFREWCVKGYASIAKYDVLFSEFFAIPRSIKMTSIKPSGTVSLLAGATPGLHYPESRHYIRRVRLEEKSSLIESLRAANYPIEKAIYEKDTVIVSIPIDMGKEIRTLNEVSMWEQFALAAFLQRYWADNQVSCTITFDPKSEGPQIANALDYYQYQMKGISLLPRLPAGAYQQMPYEKITGEQYEQMSEKIRTIEWKTIKDSIDEKQVMDHENDEKNLPDKYCTNAGCVRQ